VRDAVHEKNEENIISLKSTLIGRQKYLSAFFISILFANTFITTQIKEGLNEKNHYLNN
jgi:hypothetical protein